MTVDSIDFIYYIVIYSVQKKKLGLSEGGGLTGDYYTYPNIQSVNSFPTNFQ